MKTLTTVYTGSFGHGLRLWLADQWVLRIRRPFLRRAGQVWLRSHVPDDYARAEIALSQFRLKITTSTKQGDRVRALEREIAGLSPKALIAPAEPWNYRIGAVPEPIGLAIGEVYSTIPGCTVFGSDHAADIWLEGFAAIGVWCHRVVAVDKSGMASTVIVNDNLTHFAFGKELYRVSDHALKIRAGSPQAFRYVRYVESGATVEECNRFEASLRIERILHTNGLHTEIDRFVWHGPYKSRIARALWWRHLIARMRRA